MQIRRIAPAALWNFELRGDPEPDDRRRYVSQYDGAIAYLDFHIGRLIQHLNDIDFYENTLIIITSDRGEAFGDKNGLVEHGVSVYQEVVHVPLLIKLPRSRKSAVIDKAVSQVDL